MQSNPKNPSIWTTETLVNEIVHNKSYNIVGFLRGTSNLNKSSVVYFMTLRLFCKIYGYDALPHCWYRLCFGYCCWWRSSNAPVFNVCGIRLIVSCVCKSEGSNVWIGCEWWHVHRSKNPTTWVVFGRKAISTGPPNKLVQITLAIEVYCFWSNPFWLKCLVFSIELYYYY